MNAKAAQSASTANGGDLFKYGLASVLVIASIVGFYLFGQWPGPMRTLLVVGAVVAALALVAFTAKGRQTREYIAESRFELRKVVWPTQAETRKATLVIMLVVVIISLLLAVIDFFVSGGVRLLLGH